MARFVQYKLPADSSFSDVYFLWNFVFKSVGLFPERQGNCLWHTRHPSVLRFDCKRLTMPSTLRWRDDTSSGEDVVSSNPYGTQVPCLRSSSCCIQPLSQPWSQCPARADRCGGWSKRPGRKPASLNDSLWLILVQKRSEVLQQAIEGVKDSVLPLACVQSCPWVLPFLQADSHCRLLRGKPEMGSGLFIFK